MRQFLIHSISKHSISPKTTFIRTKVQIYIWNWTDLKTGLKISWKYVFTPRFLKVCQTLMFKACLLHRVEQWPSDMFLTANRSLWLGLLFNLNHTYTCGTIHRNSYNKVILVNSKLETQCSLPFILEDKVWCISHTMHKYIYLTCWPTLYGTIIPQVSKDDTLYPNPLTFAHVH